MAAEPQRGSYLRATAQQDSGYRLTGEQVSLLPDRPAGEAADVEERLDAVSEADANSSLSSDIPGDNENIPRPSGGAEIPDQGETQLPALGDRVWSCRRRAGLRRAQARQQLPRPRTRRRR